MTCDRTFETLAYIFFYFNFDNHVIYQRMSIAGLTAAGLSLPFKHSLITEYPI